MNRFVCGVCIGLVNIVWSSLVMAESESTFNAGASSASINPPVDSYIAGDAQNRKFESVHDDIFAKAMVFDDGETAIAILTVDCIGLPNSVVNRIRAAAARDLEGTRLSPERIVVTSSHIHNGPDVVGLWGKDMTHSGVDPEYLALLIRTAANQVVLALKNASPATLQTSTVTSKVDWVRNVCEPGELDMSLSALKVSKPDGSCIATLTNFACHPTILDGVHDVVSADWVGGLYRGLGEALSGEHLFLQGAIGGWVQPVKGDRSFELADGYGREIAAETLTALANTDVVPMPTLQFASAAVPIPLDNPGWVQLIELGVIDIDTSKPFGTEIASFVVGDAYFVTHPGETPPAYSLETRKIIGAPKTFILALGLDALGYILKPDYFVHSERYTDAEYLIATSVGPKTGPIVMEHIKTIAIRKQN